MPEENFDTPEQAETAFYRAFETLDLALMQRVWGVGERLVCLHPGIDLVLGAPAVLESWRQIPQGAHPPAAIPGRRRHPGALGRRADQPVGGRRR